MNRSKHRHPNPRSSDGLTTRSGSGSLRLPTVGPGRNRTEKLNRAPLGVERSRLGGINRILDANDLQLIRPCADICWRPVSRCSPLHPKPPKRSCVVPRGQDEALTFYAELGDFAHLAALINPILIGDYAERGRIASSKVECHHADGVFCSMGMVCCRLLANVQRSKDATPDPKGVLERFG